MNYAEARAEVIRYGQLLVEHRLIQATWGNVSLRVDDDHFLMSPSGVDYFRVKPEEVVLISVADGSYEKGLHPSSERRMHQTIYQNRPDIWAVIHTHSASCAVFAACHADLRSDELFYPCAPSMPRACDVPTSSTPRRLAPTCARRWPRTPACSMTCGAFSRRPPMPRHMASRRATSHTTRGRSAAPRVTARARYHLTCSSCPTWASLAPIARAHAMRRLRGTSSVTRCGRARARRATT